MRLPIQSRVRTGDFGFHFGYKFVSYIHEMEKPHKNPITIYGTTRHLESLAVTLHH